MRTPQFEIVSLEEVPIDDSFEILDDIQIDILVVDDERIIADTLSTILTRNGYEVITAYDGKSALTLARAYPPVLLITDVVMPGMTGIELALALETMFPEIKILLFSGQAATHDLLEEAERFGRNFTLLSKPLHPKEMLRRVADYFEDARCPGAVLTD